MVDFQKRDTRRGLRSDDDEDDEPDAESEEQEASGDADAEPDAVEGDELHETEEYTELDPESLGTAVVTVSSTRSLSDDPAGDAVVAAMEAAGHDIVTRELVQDAYDNVQQTVDRLADRNDVDVVITAGGTGITPDDVTIEAVGPLFDKKLPGFGELFRLFSYDEVATKVVSSRVTAGIVTNVPVFCLPGSERAARLGAERIIVEEAGHIAGLACEGDTDKHPR
jgi:molybdenum cofactor biosynthesis protein B